MLTGGSASSSHRRRASKEVKVKVKYAGRVYRVETSATTRKKYILVNDQRKYLGTIRGKYQRVG